jgi:hypothetical protein
MPGENFARWAESVITLSWGPVFKTTSQNCLIFGAALVESFWATEVSAKEISNAEKNRTFFMKAMLVELNIQ